MQRFFIRLKGSNFFHYFAPMQPVFGKVRACGVAALSITGMASNSINRNEFNVGIVTAATGACICKKLNSAVTVVAALIVTLRVSTPVHSPQLYRRDRFVQRANAVAG
jgi:hypothetical protein